MLGNVSIHSSLEPDARFLYRTMGSMNVGSMILSFREAATHET